jgi:hypothetical protein
MPHTPAPTNMQLARAESLGKALAHRGWAVRRESLAHHPGAIGATLHARGGIEILVLSLGAHRGQMIEITAESVVGYRREGNNRHQARDARPSWRLTTYDPPIKTILAIGIAACSGAREPTPLERAGWTAGYARPHAVDSNSSHVVRATRFTRPDGAVSATFHLPAYNPPCERCDHSGELGDAGGWMITGPGFMAEATAHTPPGVIGAFVHALPGDGGQWAAAAIAQPTGAYRAGAVSTVEVMPGATSTAAVC